jgi:hypothetical protein
VILSDFGNTYSHGVYAIVTLMAHLNATINPYVFITLNPGFKDSYKKFKGIGSIGDLPTNTGSIRISNSRGKEMKMVAGTYKQNN